MPRTRASHPLGNCVAVCDCCAADKVPTGPQQRSKAAPALAFTTHTLPSQPVRRTRAGIGETHQPTNPRSDTRITYARVGSRSHLPWYNGCHGSVPRTLRAGWPRGARPVAPFSG
eukprot:359590-Chlamydomonas_euryale.AAC.16